MSAGCVTTVATAVAAAGIDAAAVDAATIRTIALLNYNYVINVQVYIIIMLVITECA